MSKTLSDRELARQANAHAPVQEANTDASGQPENVPGLAPKFKNAERQRKRHTRLMLFYLKQQPGQQTGQVPSPSEDEIGAADYQQLFNQVHDKARFSEGGFDGLRTTLYGFSHRMKRYSNYENIPTTRRIRTRKEVLDSLGEKAAAMDEQDIERLVLNRLNAGKKKQYMDASDELVLDLQQEADTRFKLEKRLFHSVFRDDFRRRVDYDMMVVENGGLDGYCQKLSIGAKKKLSPTADEFAERSIGKGWRQADAKVVARVEAVLSPIRRNWGSEKPWSDEMEAEYVSLHNAGIIHTGGQGDELGYMVDNGWSPSRGLSPEAVLNHSFAISKFEAIYYARRALGGNYAEAVSGKYEVDESKRHSENPVGLALFSKREISKDLSSSVVDRFEIGSESGPHGHLIDGGHSTPREGVRETIVVDWEKDIHMQKIYGDILRDAGMAGDYRPDGVEREQLLHNVFTAIKKNISYNKYAFDSDEQILIGESIKRNEGCCRHMGIACAAVLERMITEDKLGGKVFYVRGKNHGWAVYESRRKQRVVFDPAQYDNLIPADDERAMYLGGGGVRRYDEATAIRRVDEMRLRAGGDSIAGSDNSEMYTRLVESPFKKDEAEEAEDVRIDPDSVADRQRRKRKSIWAWLGFGRRDQN